MRRDLTAAGHNDEKVVDTKIREEKGKSDA